MITKGPTVYSEKVALLLKAEATRGVDAQPDPAIDAFLVGNVMPGVDPQLLERDNYRPSFSPDPSEVGRKVMSMSFTHEIKGSGSAARPKLGTLLNACRMKEILITAGAANQIETPVVAGVVTGPEVAFDKTTAPTQRYGSYLLKVVEGGASATAKIQVFRWNQADMDATVLMNTRHEAATNHYAQTTFTLDDSDETSLEFTVAGTVTTDDTIYAVVGGNVFSLRITASMTTPTEVAAAMAALIDAHDLLSASAALGVITVTFDSNAEPVTVTSGSTEIMLGDSGAGITPTWTGNLVKGQMWLVPLYETGYTYLPSSNDDETPTVTIHAYIDGQLWRMTAAIGTVTFSGTAGNYGSAQFEFTGVFHQPAQQPVPRNVAYELSRPPKVELAQMSIRGDKDFCAESFNIALGNDISERLCMNALDGYAGSELSGRTASMTVNPEGTLEVYRNMWGDFTTGEEVPLHLRVGTQVNNMVRFYVDNATYTGIVVSDRNRRQVVEPQFQLNRVSYYGDDELRIVFC